MLRPPHFITAAYLIIVPDKPATNQAALLE